MMAYSDEINRLMARHLVDKTEDNRSVLDLYIRQFDKIIDVIGGGENGE